MISNFESSFRQYRLIRIGIVVAIGVLLLASLVAVQKQRYEAANAEATIVLATTLQEAAASLGGQINKKTDTVMVALLNAAAATSTALEVKIENLGYSADAGNTADADALSATQLLLSKDIQALIASYSDKRIVYVYGPATMGNTPSDPQRELLYQAFLDVISSYPEQKLKFYFYENYPSVEEFNGKSVKSLKRYLEDATSYVLNTIEISLTRQELSQKAEVLETVADIGIANRAEDYTSKRCNNRGACEVVYEVARF